MCVSWGSPNSSFDVLAAAKVPTEIDMPREARLPSFCTQVIVSFSIYYPQGLENNLLRNITYWGYCVNKAKPQSHQCSFDM